MIFFNIAKCPQHFLNINSCPPTIPQCLSQCVPITKHYHECVSLCFFIIKILMKVNKEQLIYAKKKWLYFILFETTKTISWYNNINPKTLFNHNLKPLPSNNHHTWRYKMLLQNMYMHIFLISCIVTLLYLTI